MDLYFEILLIFILIAIQSIFGVGLLLFGTPSFLLFGYDFANTINILMPISITISALQFFKSKKRDNNFLKEYNLYCLPFLIIFLLIALNFKEFFDFKLLVAILLILSSILILNKKRFSSFKNHFFKFKKIVLVGIGCVHGLTNMGGSFLAIYSTLVSKNVKLTARYYICYGYLIMGIVQYLLVLIISFSLLQFDKLYYVFFAFIIYFPLQKIFNKIDDKNFSIIINFIALIYGFLIIIS